MTIAEEAHVVVLVADYIGVDAGGKINALGAGFLLAGVQPTGLSAPQSLVVIIDTPGRYNNQQFSITVTLMDETTGHPVMLPMGADGALQPLRIQQVATVQVPIVPGAFMPQDVVPGRVQMPIAFMDGLPVVPNHLYRWQAAIDGHENPAWTARFYVPGPPPAPVVGGLHGPASIANVVPFGSPPAEPPVP